MTRISLVVNGEPVDADVEPRTSLADFLRGTCGLTGTHLGCEHGVCGACTVLLDGQPVRSCITYAVQADGGTARSIEDFDGDAVMAELRTAFSREHGLQCGFCTPGMLITARDIVLRLGDPGEERVREELAGNLCRCTGYVGIVRAIRSVGATHADATPVEIAAPSRSAAIPPPPAPARIAAARPQAAAPALAVDATPGDASIALRIHVPADIDRAWAFFRDLPAVAACIPGAELAGYDDRTLHGHIRIRFGPIRATVAGSGEYRFDDASRSGRLGGTGNDTLSGSRVRGALEFRLAESGPASTAVDVSLSFALQGMLAQFSRGAIVRKFAASVLDQFARNASSALTGAPPGPPADPGEPSWWRSWMRRLWTPR